MEETKFDRAKYMTSHHIEGRPLSGINQSPSNLDNKDDKESPKNTSPDNIIAATPSSPGNDLQADQGGVDLELTKKSRFARLKPIESQNLRGENRLLRLIGRPILLLLFPIIFYAGFIYGCNIVWLSVLNATESMVLSNPPYSMSTSTVGLTFISPLVGTTLAYVLPHLHTS